MKRGFCALLALILALWALAPAGLAEAGNQIEVYVARGALDAQRARRLTQLLQQAMPEAAFSLRMEEETGESLRALVLMDRAPDVALCTPEAAFAWAREGLLLPLEGAIYGAERMAPAVLETCVYEESAFMAPLFARHRVMAVNRRMLEEMGLDAMIDAREYPVWLPMQMQQVLEEFALEGAPAMDVWLPEEDGAAILALVQAMYCAPLLSDGGQIESSGALQAGVSWLHEMVSCGLIGVAGSREEALARFLAGQTAIFCDWTDEEALLLRAGKQELPEVVTMPHPSSAGLPVRAFTAVGAAVFKTGDEPHDRLAYEAAAFLTANARVQEVLGERAIFEDDAIWLPCLGTSAQGAALSGAFAQALSAVIEGRMEPHEAVRAAQAALDGISP